MTETGLHIVATSQPIYPVKTATAPFALQFLEPYSTFKNGQPLPVPYVIDGWLANGGFSILAGKPKLGKSSLARCEAVCVAKGQPLLERQTTQGEVILISLEDSDSHTDNCLNALGYDPTTDAKIHIVNKLAPSIDDSIDAIGAALEKMPNVRLVIVDTLAKLLRVDDMNDYSRVLGQVEKVHNLARKFPQLHVQGLAHCKKAKTDNPFDSLLGSSALRGETDTTIALYEEGSQTLQKVLAIEARQGRGLEPRIITAQLTEIAGANVVQSYALGKPVSEWMAEISSKKDLKRKASLEERIIRYLSNRPNESASRVLVLEEVEGKQERKIEAIQTLIEADVVTVTGQAQNQHNPLWLHLDRNALRLHDFISHRGEPGL